MSWGLTSSEVPGLLAAVVVNLSVGGSFGLVAGRIAGATGTEFWSMLALGILGSLVGSVFFDFLGLLSTGIVASLIAAAIGAMVVLMAAAAAPAKGRRGR